MDTGETFRPRSMGETEAGNPTDNPTTAALSTAPSSTGEDDSPVSEYDTGTNMRSTVEQRFTRMSHAHDRIRTEWLARHPPRQKLV